MFVDGPPVMLQGLMDFLADDPVDVVLVDPTEAGSMVAAEARGVPMGAVVPGRRSGFVPGLLPYDPAERAGSFVYLGCHTYDALRESAGLEPLDLLLGEYAYDRTFSLCMAPESFNGWALPAQHHTSHPLRPTYEVDVEHDRLTKTSWVSMDRLMGQAEISVHHAGWGSTIAALATGTPSVAIPIGADQFGNAQAIQNTGAGVSVQRDRVSNDMTEAVRTVLDNEIYRLNAERLKSEIDAMPSAEECVPLVEELGEKGVVFNKS